MKTFLTTAALVMFTTAALAGQPGVISDSQANAKNNPPPTQLTSKQRGDIARGLVHKWAPEIRQQGGNVREWAIKLGRHIGTADAFNVQRAANMPTFDAMMGTLQGQTGTGPAAAKLGDELKDLVYTPLPNGRCRVADSRNIGAPLSPFVERDIDVEDASTYAAQGGTGSAAGQGSSNCGIPGIVAAYAVSLTILPPAGTPSGLLKVYENGKDWSEGNPVLFTTGDFGASNDVIVRSCQSCALELAIQSGSATHYVIDIVGYFIKPQATELDCLSMQSGAVTVSPSGFGTVSTGNCPAGYTITGGGCSSSNQDGRVVTSRLVVDTASQTQVCAFKNEGTAATLQGFAFSRCCRTPGR